MLTPKDFKEVPARKSAASGDYQQFDYFQNFAAHSFRPSSQSFEPVNAWWLMELSMLSYTSVDFARGQLSRAGLEPPRTFGAPGLHAAQAMVTGTSSCIFVIFRGTESHRMYDVIADIDALPGFVDAGYVHAGFARALNRDGCWNQIKEHLNSIRDDRRIFFTGHSMGAALATLAIQQFRDRNERALQIYTFGSPRVGGLTFKHNFGPFPSFRVVNDHDPVPHLPPPPVYWHVPELIHIGPENAPIHRNTFAGMTGSFGSYARSLGDFRRTHRERSEDAEAILSPDDPRFESTFRRPLSHHNPKVYCAKIWNHYVWSELAANPAQPQFSKER